MRGARAPLVLLAACSVGGHTEATAKKSHQGQLSSPSLLPIKLANCRYIRSSTVKRMWAGRAWGSYAEIALDGKKPTAAKEEGTCRSATSNALQREALLFEMKASPELPLPDWRIDVRFASPAGERLYDVTLPDSGRILIPPMGALQVVHLFW